MGNTSITFPSELRSPLSSTSHGQKIVIGEASKNKAIINTSSNSINYDFDSLVPKKRISHTNNPLLSPVSAYPQNNSPLKTSIDSHVLSANKKDPHTMFTLCRDELGINGQPVSYKNTPIYNIRENIFIKNLRKSLAHISSPQKKEITILPIAPNRLAETHTHSKNHERISENFKNPLTLSEAYRQNFHSFEAYPLSSALGSGIAINKDPLSISNYTKNLIEEPDTDLFLPALSTAYEMISEEANLYQSTHERIKTHKTISKIWDMYHRKIFYCADSNNNVKNSYTSRKKGLQKTYDNLAHARSVLKNEEAYVVNVKNQFSTLSSEICIRNDLLVKWLEYLFVELQVNYCKTICVSCLQQSEKHALRNRVYEVKTLLQKSKVLASNKMSTLVLIFGLIR